MAQEVAVMIGRLDEIDDPGCREFRIGEGEWPFRGFVVRKADAVHAYQNYCVHAGHPLNFKPDSFLTTDNSLIICSSHGALFDIESGNCVAGPCPGKTLRRVRAEVIAGEVIVYGPDSA